MLKITVVSIIFMLSLSWLSASEQEIVENSPFTLGFSFGFSSLIPGNGSSSFADLTDNKRQEGVIGGFFFEYNLHGTKSSLFFSTDALDMKRKVDNDDSKSIISFNTVGIKSKILDAFYISPAVGILSGERTQFIRSFSLGFDALKDNKSTVHFAFSVIESDFKDIFLLLKFQTSYKL